MLQPFYAYTPRACVFVLCQVVEEYAAAMGAGLDEELGHTLTDLDSEVGSPFATAI
jgi:hypothetical protein